MSIDVESVDVEGIDAGPHADLVALIAAEAARVQAGDYNDLLPEHWSSDERWAVRLRANDDADVWLISWVPQQSTQLHDHAGSLGALTVIHGSLVEYRWDGAALRERRFDAGDHATFDRGWVHDVARHPDADDRSSAPTEHRTEPLPTPLPTLSVHAYSPPLTAMSFYDITKLGRLRRVRTELTTHPEPPTPAARGIDALLSAARSRIDRVAAHDVEAEVASGAILVDIRPAAQRAAEGEIAGALVIERNVLEWRLDPTHTARIAAAVDWNVRWLIVCSEGYTSSLAAAALRDIGLHRAADVSGGFHALQS